MAEASGGLARGETILDVRDLQTVFYTEKETIRAVDGISFDVGLGETVGIVGESGSGKSVTARSIMGLVERPGRVLEGSSIRFHHAETVRRFADRYPRRTVDLEALQDRFDPAALFDDPTVHASLDEFAEPGEEPPSRDEIDVVDAIDAGYGEALGLIDADDFVFVEAYEGSGRQREATSGYVELTRASEGALRRLRGGAIAMVFQDPLTSLNPVYTVGNQIEEALSLHQGLSGAAATREAVDLLESVGISDARRRIREYPHQFSGGMRQRAVIAMALACDPEVLICDEPTTALDVTIQAQILELLADLQAERDLSIVFITHDMGVIAEVADRVDVMYAGEIVETADVETLFADPRHPYTQGLLESIPGRQVGRERLSTIEGDVPTPTEKANYCRFAPRCPEVFEDCWHVHPEPLGVERDEAAHTAACLLYPADADRDERVDRHERHGQRGDRHGRSGVAREQRPDGGGEVRGDGGCGASEDGGCGVSEDGAHSGDGGETGGDGR